MMIYDKDERPPMQDDADAQGCVLAWDVHGSGWVIRHWKNLAGMRWWTRLPRPPREVEKDES